MAQQPLLYIFHMKTEPWDDVFLALLTPEQVEALDPMITDAYAVQPVMGIYDPEDIENIREEIEEERLLAGASSS